MNPMRDELPDIDIDVESARREDVYDMVLSRHGDDRARLRRHDRHVPGALGRPRGRQGARPARRRARGRGEGVPAHLGAATCARRSSVCRSSTASTCRCRQLELLFRVAERLDGFPRHIALHPCGIVLSNHELVDAGAARARARTATG